MSLSLLKCLVTEDSVDTVLFLISIENVFVLLFFHRPFVMITRSVMQLGAFTAIKCSLPSGFPCLIRNALVVEHTETFFSTNDSLKMTMSQETLQIDHESLSMKTRRGKNWRVTRPDRDARVLSKPRVSLRQQSRC